MKNITIFLQKGIIYCTVFLLLIGMLSSTAYADDHETELHGCPANPNWWGWGEWHSIDNLSSQAPNGDKGIIKFSPQRIGTHKIQIKAASHNISGIFIIPYRLENGRDWEFWSPVETRFTAEFELIAGHTNVQFKFAVYNQSLFEKDIEYRFLCENSDTPARPPTRQPSNPPARPTPSNPWDDAITLRMNEPQIHDINPANDDDWFTFRISQDRTAAFLWTDGDSGDTILELYDESGKLIASDDDGGSNYFSRIYYSCDRPFARGIYYAKVQSHRHASVISDYKVGLSFFNNCN